MAEWEKVEPTGRQTRTTLQRAPEAIVIVGGGAAGEAAAKTLRREGYSGPITMLSDDDPPPCDRPNLSKDYLAGNAFDDAGEISEMRTEMPEVRAVSSSTTPRLTPISGATAHWCRKGHQGEKCIDDRGQDSRAIHG